MRDCSVTTDTACHSLVSVIWPTSLHSPELASNWRMSAKYSPSQPPEITSRVTLRVHSTLSFIIVNSAIDATTSP